MDTKKIQALEDKVRDLFCSPKASQHFQSKKDVNDTLELFWVLHLKPVIDISKELAEKYKADLEVVWLGAVLYDIARLDNSEPHDEIGADRAYEMLIAEGFDKDTASAVKDVVFTHRIKEHKPETLEQKIIASADTISHFKAPFYLWFSAMSPKPFPDQLEFDLKKMARDYNDKIFFDDERQAVKPEYDILKQWCDYRQKLS